MNKCECQFYRNQGLQDQRDACRDCVHLDACPRTAKAAPKDPPESCAECCIVHVSNMETPGNEKYWCTYFKPPKRILFRAYRRRAAFCPCDRKEGGKK